MKNYYRVMLGAKSIHAGECFAGNFIGADFGIQEDLSRNLPDNLRAFNQHYVPILLQNRPDKTRVGAGLSCGALWTVSKEIRKGDIVLCPDGEGSYRVGEVLGDYYFASGQSLPHRRKVNWLTLLPRSAMSDSLRNSAGSIGTVSDVSDYRAEIEQLIAASTAPSQPTITGSRPEIEDPVAFAMEIHLEDFLVANWAQTELGREFTIYEDEGEAVGKQYRTDAGKIDILAESKDKKRLLVVELKRGQASDVVVGQTLRYMGVVKEQLAEPDQTVEGVIIGLEDDPKLRWAISMVPAISFYRYQVSFKLVKG